MKLLLLIPLLLISCSSTKKKEDEKKDGKIKGPDQVIVGRIASVSKLGKFVLIQQLGKGKLPQGIVYQARGPEGRTASLRPSGERVRDFYAADLLSGEAAKGDAVIAYQNIKTKKDEVAEDNESTSENEQTEKNHKKNEDSDKISESPKDDQDA